MIGLLIWLLGAGVMVYELTAHHLWQQLFAAMLGALFILWCGGGAMILHFKAKMAAPKQAPQIPTPLQRSKLAEIAKAQRAEPSEAAK